jgi:nucleotide-binding universal stress UspA family protein
MFKHILVPTDGSPLSLKAVRMAVKAAVTSGAKLTVLHVTPDYDAYVSERYNVPPMLVAPVKEKFDREAAGLAKKVLERACREASAAGVRCSGVRVASDSVYRILLGSETQKVLTHSKLPVLVCR